MTASSVIFHKHLIQAPPLVIVLWYSKWT